MPSRLHAVSSGHPPRRIVPLLALAAIASSIGCGSDSTPVPNSQSTTLETRESRAKQVQQPAAEYGPQQQIVRIDTTMGAIVIKLDVEKAPSTVHNFLNYASDGFYDNTLFHYAAPGSMILGGGYTADYQPKPLTLPPVWNEAQNGRKNLRATIAMARDAAVVDSATSQFFINLADAPQRDHTGDSPAEFGYCVFGDIIEGLDVADRIAESPTQDKGGDLAQTPQTPVIIKTVRVL